MRCGWERELYISCWWDKLKFNRGSGQHHDSVSRSLLWVEGDGQLCWRRSQKVTTTPRVDPCVCGYGLVRDMLLQGHPRGTGTVGLVVSIFGQNLKRKLNFEVTFSHIFRCLVFDGQS